MTLRYIKYPKYLPMSISMLLQIPKILWKIKQEHNSLNEIINDYNIDGVISDNRFGLYTKKVPCVFITHQLNIQSPYFSNDIKEFNIYVFLFTWTKRKLTSKFNRKCKKYFLTLIFL